MNKSENQITTLKVFKDPLWPSVKRWNRKEGTFWIIGRRCLICSIYFFSTVAHKKTCSDACCAENQKRKRIQLRQTPHYQIVQKKFRERYQKDPRSIEWRRRYRRMPHRKLREAQIHKQKMATDPKYATHYRIRQNNNRRRWFQRNYHNFNEKSREKYAQDSNFRENYLARQRAYQNRKYRTDSNWRQRRLNFSKKHHQKISGNSNCPA